MKPLTGQVALVTGASRGIGRAIARELAQQGADIVINYRSDESAAQSLADELAKLGVSTLLIQADVSDPDAVSRLFEHTLMRFSRLDILVNNAGIRRDTLILRMKDEAWQEVLDVNLNSVFYCARLAAKIMLKQKNGRIINITSASGVIGNAGQTNYSAAKAGVIGFTRALARELASRQIAVNAVAPGLIISDMTDTLAVEAKNALLGQIPLGRFGSPEDVAAVVSFLAVSAPYMTGQVLHVDGGLVMH